MPLRLLLLFLFAVLAAPPAAGQPTVSGRVLDLDGGAPLPEVRVAYCQADGTPADPPRTTWTDAAGRYVLAGSPRGPWRVCAAYAAADLTYVVASPPFVADAPPVLDFVLPTALRERLRDAQAPADANPKSLATITGLLQDGYAADAQGHALPGSRARLLAETQSRLQGRVTRHGAGLAGVQVQVIGTSRHTRSDADGRFLLTGLAPGRYPLRFLHHTDTLALPAFDVRPGLNTLHLTLNP